MSNTLDDIPTVPFGEIVGLMIRKLGKIGKIPGHNVNLTKHHAALRSSIQKENERLLLAKTPEQIDISRAKLELLKKDENVILDGAKRAAIQMLLKGKYACVGYLNGQMVIVPSAHFAEDIDWQNESLRFQDHLYTRLQLIHGRQLSQEQLAMIRRCAAPEAPETESQTSTPTSTGAPGRPSSMSFVEAEFDRRARESLTAPSLKEESEILAAWLKRSHPDAPQPTPKTIKNRLRHAYNKLKVKNSPQAG